MIDTFIDFNSESTAIESGDLILSYKDLKHKALYYAEVMRKNGLKAGDRICLVTENALDFYTLLLSCFFSGFVVNPLSKDASEVYKNNILAIFKPKAMIGGIEELGKYKSEACVRQPVDVPVDSMALVTFTSGTTGQPKGVCHSLKNLLACSKAFNSHHKFNKKLVMYNIMPRYYMAGILNTFLCTLVCGGRVILGSTFSASNAGSFFIKMKERQANCTWMSPTMLLLAVKMTRSQEVSEWLNNEEVRFLIGTAPLPAQTKKLFKNKLSGKALESYGTSELLFISSIVDGEEELDSTGRPLKEVELEILEDGELKVETPWAMLGYLNSPEDAKETGDIGIIQDGYLKVTGRKKDIIIKGGENISPRYIEDISLKYKGIEDSCVVAVKHEFWGEVPYLYIIPNNSFNIKEMKEHLCNSLSKEMRPERIILVASFPRTVTGKIIKDDLLKDSLCS